MMSAEDYLIQEKYLRKIYKRIKTLESAQKEIQIIIDELNDEHLELFKKLGVICKD